MGELRHREDEHQIEEQLEAGDLVTAGRTLPQQAGALLTLGPRSSHPHPGAFSVHGRLRPRGLVQTVPGTRDARPNDRTRRAGSSRQPGLATGIGSGLRALASTVAVVCPAIIRAGPRRNRRCSSASQTHWCCLRGSVAADQTISTATTAVASFSSRAIPGQKLRVGPRICRRPWKCNVHRHRPGRTIQEGRETESAHPKVPVRDRPSAPPAVNHVWETCTEPAILRARHG